MSRVDRRAAARFADREENERRHEQARRASHKEGHAPPINRRDEPSDQQARNNADLRERVHETRCELASLGWKIVCESRIGCWRVAGLADPDPDPNEKQMEKTLCDAAHHRDDTP